MTMMMKMLAGAAGIAALAATPAAAQYGYANPYAQSYGYANPYAAQNPYGSQYGYGNPYAAQMNQVAAQRCSAAVQSRLSQPRRSGGGIAGILGAVLGANTMASTGRVLSITRVSPNRSAIRVRGLATSGQYAGNGYGAYGYGAYGAAGYGYQPDLAFKCDVDYRGYIRDIDIVRR